jgi:hypothetical protein
LHCQHHIEGGGEQARLGIGPSVSFLYRTVFPLEDAADELVGGTLGVDNQQAAGTQDISLH